MERFSFVRPASSKSAIFPSFFAGDKKPCLCDEARVNRSNMLERARSAEIWDVAIIGGGATGLACAWDAALRGHRTILIDKSDFAKGTSSRTTKLIHGGVRYLKQGNIKLVREALRERARLLRNAPDLVKPLPFVIPGFSWREKMWYALGLRVYDMLSGFKRACPGSKLLNRAGVSEALPGLKPDELSGGVRYFDAQFDDSRLAVALARSAAHQNGCVLNYVGATGFRKTEDGRLAAIEAVDELSGQQLLIRAKAFVNATGVFADAVLKMDDADAEPIIQPAQGIHLALDSSFLESDSHALMIPKTDDGRVLFAIPWHGRILLGTTDTPKLDAEYEPRPLEEEIDYLLEHAARYLTKPPTRADVLSTWAGLRPLVRPKNGKGETKEISRSHSLFVSKSGLITIVGGKWTTCRLMAEDTIDRAERESALDPRKCLTATQKLAPESPETDSPRLHERLPYHESDIRRAVSEEMAMTVEDALSRRTRSLLLDAEASLEAAPRVAEIMAEVAGHPPDWIITQIEDFEKLARRYLPK